MNGLEWIVMIWIKLGWVVKSLSEMDWDLIWSEVEWDGIELNEIEENCDGRELNGMKTLKLYYGFITIF